MEAFFSNLFEGVGHERSSILIISMIEPNIWKQSKFIDNEIKEEKILL